jgi:hypothetical protein
MPLRLKFGPELATEAQREALRGILKNSPDLARVNAMTKAEASERIALHAKSWRRYSATRYQEQFLRPLGLWHDRLDRGTASDLIGAAKQRELEEPGYLDRVRRRVAAPYLYDEEGWLKGSVEAKAAPPAEDGPAPDGTASP